jgi:prepilin-type N-terminal cleavage/methylation domain-containing protein
MKKICPGFTLIELMIVLSIIGLLFTFGFAQYVQFNRQQMLIQSAQELKNNLRYAQSKALAGEKPTACGVYALQGYKLAFSNSQNYEIKAVCNNTDFVVRTGLSLRTNVELDSGPNPVTFKVLAQGVITPGTFVLRYSGTTNTESVTVTETGEIR